MQGELISITCCHRERGLLSLLPLLVACVALVVISLGAGERQVRKDRREVGWKGIAGCTLFSGTYHTLSSLTLSFLLFLFRLEVSRQSVRIWS